MSFIVDKEIGFPIPSEKEKINKALKRYRKILAMHPKRSDAPELMFGIADLLVGRNDPGDYAEAFKYYDFILLRNPPSYLKARALVGKAELMIVNRDELGNAISLCDQARKILGSDVSDFFAAKTLIVEAELCFVRKEKGDWAKTLNLISQVIKEKNAHWYFRGRALLTKTEVLLFRDPDDITTALKTIEFALKELKSRPDDYFSLKGNLLKADLLIRRGKKRDLEKAEKLLSEIIKTSFAYKALIARAKISLANIVNHPKASRLIKQVHEMEGIDPYLIEKASLLQKSLNQKPAKKTKKKGKSKKR
ncbi:MAG: hypothetical protein ABIH69_05140 [bacterium]